MVLRVTIDCLQVGIRLAFQQSRPEQSIARSVASVMGGAGEPGLGRVAMSSRPLLQRNLTEFFRDLLQGAMRSQEVRSSEDTEFYLVKLLEGFAHAPTATGSTGRWRSSTWNPFTARWPHRYGKLKRVGDTALFVSGLFMESLHRQAGRAATTTCSSGAPRTRSCRPSRATSARGRGDLFAELAERFRGFRARAGGDQLRDAVPRRRAHAARLHALDVHAQRARCALAAYATGSFRTPAERQTALEPLRRPDDRHRGLTTAVGVSDGPTLRSAALAARWCRCRFRFLPMTIVNSDRATVL